MDKYKVLKVGETSFRLNFVKDEQFVKLVFVPGDV